MLLIIITFALLFSSPASAEKLIFYPGDAPLSHSEGQPARGLYFDIVTAIFNRMGESYQIEELPFKRALHHAYQDQGIVVGIGTTDERRSKLDFSDSIYDSTVVAFVKKEKIFPFTSITDLKGKTIATKLGWSYGEQFDQAKQRNLFNAIEGKPHINFKSMLLGRIDVFIDNRLTGIATMKALGAENLITVLPHPIQVFPHYLGFKKGVHTDLIERFNQELTAFKLSSDYKKIMSNYN